MAYTLDNSPAAMNAPRTLQTSATTWQQLANPAPPVRRVKIRMGGGEETLILPVFSPRLGDDVSDQLAQDLSDAGYGGMDVPSDLGTSLVPQSTLNTLYPINATGQLEGPLGNTAVFSTGPTIPLATALANASGGGIAVAPGAATTPGTSAYQSLINAGLTAAQLANVASSGTSQVVAPVAAQSSILPGISNTSLLIAAVIGVIILSGKKR